MGAQGPDAAAARSARIGSARGDEIAIAVVGAHLSGMALNGELQALGGAPAAKQPRPRRTTGSMRSTPPRRSPACCASSLAPEVAIKLEVWALSAAAFGKFVAAIPPPLSIGTIRLADGRGVKGFIVGPQAIDGARDISSFGGWRAFMAQKAACDRRGAPILSDGLGDAWEDRPNHVYRAARR